MDWKNGKNIDELKIIKNDNYYGSHDMWSSDAAIYIDEKEVNFINGIAAVNACVIYNKKSRVWACSGVIDENYNEYFNTKNKYGEELVITRNLMFYGYNSEILRVGENDFFVKVKLGYYDSGAYRFIIKHIRLNEGKLELINGDIGANYEKTSSNNLLITSDLFGENKRLYDVSSGQFLEDKKIYPISNGVDTKFFKKNEKLGQEFRKKYGYTDDDKVVIGIGLYIERKGIVDFVELASKMKDYQFIWFGYSPKSMATKDVRKALETELDNLTFAGYVESKMIKAAMSGCDVYIFPTYEETEGIPLIEAFAASCNTVVRDIPVFSEYEEGKIVYKAKNNREFKKKIEDIVEGRLPSLKDNALQVAYDKDISVVGKKLKEVYESVLED